VYPHPGALLDADVVVAPLQGSPEYVLYRESLEDYTGPVVAARDPYHALASALSHPKRGFTRLIIGVDPGRECGVAVIADGVVVRLEKTPCRSLAPTIIESLDRYPSARAETYIGDGYGFSRAVESMEEAGLAYVIVDESGTTRPSAYAGLFSRVKDRDLLAGLAIALKGAYGSGRLAPQVRGGDRLRGLRDY